MVSSPRKIVVRLRYGSPLTRRGIAEILQEQPDMEVQIDEPDAASVGRADDLAHATPPDVVVADYETGLEASACSQLIAPYTRIPKVLVVTARDTEAEIRRALNGGVRGYLLLQSSTADVVGAVRAVDRGQCPFSALVSMRIAESLHHDELTSRELDVLRLLARGYPNKAICTSLDIAMGTVKSHVKGILVKLRASSRTEATIVAERRGLLAALQETSESREVASLWRHHDTPRVRPPPHRETVAFGVPS